MIQGLVDLTGPVVSAAGSDGLREEIDFQFLGRPVPPAGGCGGDGPVFCWAAPGSCQQNYQLHSVGAGGARDPACSGEETDCSCLSRLGPSGEQTPSELSIAGPSSGQSSQPLAQAEPETGASAAVSPLAL